jgi:hypothetical protein
MSEHTSERRRWEERREVDDDRREIREEDKEVQEHKNEAGEVGNPQEHVEVRLDEAMRELAEQEVTEEKISHKLEEALGDLERMEKSKESTETKLREALDSLEDDASEAEKVEVNVDSEVSDVATDASESLDVEQEVREKPEDGREIRENSDGKRTEGQSEESESMDDVEEVPKQLDERIESKRETASEVMKEESCEFQVSIEEERYHNSSQEKTSHFGEINTREDFEEALERYSELEYRSSHQTRLEEATDYFEDTENGKDSAKPSIVKELEDREIRRMYETVHGGPPEVKIESMEDVDRLLQDYPEERERKNFDERYRHSDVCFQIRGNFSIKRDDLAEMYDIGHGLAGDFRNGIEATLIRDLRRNEEEKAIREWYESGPEISQKTLEAFRAKETVIQSEGSEKRTGVHSVESQAIREATEHLRDKKNITVDDVVSTLKELNQASVNNRNRIRYADFREAIDSDTMKKIERVIRTERTELEKAISEKLGLNENCVRVAVADGRIYTWIPKARPDELVDAYEKQFYYFNNHKELTRVVEELGGKLGVEGNKRQSLNHLNEITRQLIDGGGEEAARARPIENKSLRLEGKVIRLYLDTTNMKLSNLEGRVTKVTGINGQAGIDNPRFPEGKQLEILKARLAAIISSDCYLAESGRISYNEENLERIAKVQEILRNFGDITLVPKLHHGVYENHIPNQIGLMMIHEGMTPGSKVIQNPGLPKGYVNWSEEACRAYLEELIPEEGNFRTHRGFSWNRNHALYDEAEGGKHHFKSVISTAEIQLIIDEGRRTKGLVPQHNLAYGKLDELQFSDDLDKSIPAKRLIDAVKNSPNNLIEDEKKIAESLGIQISLSSSSIRYYPRSERVSVRHDARTTTKNDAIRWGTICPPNDQRKREQVEDWLRELAEDWLNKKEWVDWFE